MGGEILALRQYSFEKDLVLSQNQERKFGEYLSRLGIKGVEYAPKSIIFEDWDVSAAGINYEIKADRWMENTGNFCLETSSCLEKNSLGWFFKTKADIIVVFFNPKEFVFVSMEDLKNAWFECPKIWTKKEIKQENWTTICWLANCKEIKGLKIGAVE